jgi:hypothetical protein
MSFAGMSFAGHLACFDHLFFVRLCYSSKGEAQTSLSVFVFYLSMSAFTTVFSSRSQLPLAYRAFFCSSA